MMRFHRVAAVGRRAIVLQGCMASLCLIADIAQAQMLIQPVVVELVPRQRAVAVSVTLSEAAPAPVRLQAELLRWKQDLEGHSVTAPSDDLIVSPPIGQGTRPVSRGAAAGARRKHLSAEDQGGLWQRRAKRSHGYADIFHQRRSSSGKLGPRVPGGGDPGLPAKCRFA
jgi:hypothetical protein